MKLKALTALILCTAALARGGDDYERPPISYSDSQPNDVIQRLQSRLDQREFAFSGAEREVLDRVLNELHVPKESQLLVFSKTSVQRVRISPTNPRAIYFNDECYVGWVPGGIIEVAAIDPKLGPIFYTLDPMERGTAVQRFRRDAECLSCHAVNFTRDIPGIFARSMYIEPSGSPIYSAGSELVDQTTPFDVRWGGWYVTGHHGAGRHRGNVFAEEKDNQVTLDTERGANLDSLKKLIDTAKYPMPTSDIGALLVFEHQLTVQNALTRANYECLRMLDYQRGLQESFKEPLTDEPTYTSVKSVFDHSAETVLDALLYKDEAALPKGGVQCSPEFRDAFQKNGKSTTDGRNLRQLDLMTRIAKNRCSHLVHSAQFRALPKPLLQRIGKRMDAILNADKPDARYAYLEPEERKTIAAVIRATEPELTRDWRP